MTATEYACDELIHIRRCPEFISPIGNKPPYWYIMKPLWSFDAHPALSRHTIADLYSRGFHHWYWSGSEWWYCTPKQFATAEEAYAEYQDKMASDTFTL